MRPVKKLCCKEHVMPVYAYRCDNCGLQFERQQSYTEPALRICPECRRKSLKRIISPVRIVFKGSGFYVTDYARKSRGGGSGGESSSKKDSSSGKKDNGS